MRNRAFAFGLAFYATAVAPLSIAAQATDQFRDSVHQAAGGRFRDFAGALSASQRSGGLVVSLVHDVGTSLSRPSALQQSSGAVPWDVVERAFTAAHPGYITSLSNSRLVKVRPALPNACSAVLRRRSTPGVISGTLDELLYAVAEVASPALKERGRGGSVGSTMGDAPVRNTIKVTIELTRDMTIEDALDEIAASTAGTVWLVAEGERDGRRSCVPTLYTREATAFFGIDLLQ